MVALPNKVVALRPESTLHQARWNPDASVQSALVPAPDAIHAFLADTIGEAVQLVAIVPEGPPPTGRWFGDNARDAAIWAAERNAEGANVYWTVNRVRDGLNGKPRKSDIIAARFAHVDIDPPKNGSAWDKAGALAALAELGSAPSFVIDSGGGWQAFWRLEEESSNLDAIETINTGIRDRFGADPCQNIDRLMRLPATVNWPDARKRARGRVPTLASMAEEDDGTVHQPYVLAHRFPVATPKPDVGAADRSPPQGRAALITADDLSLGAFDPIRATIDYPSGRDRSRDAQAAAGDMARAGFSDDQIEGVLFNPTNPVSAHCLAQANPVRAAWRCISKARADIDRRALEAIEGAAIATAMVGPCNKPDDAFDFENVADWHDVDPGEQEWVLADWMPLEEATLLTGAGAIGKSLVAQQLAACIAAGKPFMGIPVTAAPTIYITCEDPRKVLIRRQKAIAALIGVTLQDLDQLCWVKSWRGELGNELAIFDRERRIVPTERFHRLREKALELGARLIVLDNTSHLFGGDENAKREVAAFCNMLNTLAEVIGGAVLLLGHPNKAGTNDGAVRGNQYGGSVAWENQVRSRMFMAGDPDDRDARTLENPKANYSAKGGKLSFRWHAGAFTRPDDLDKNQAAEMAAIIADNADEKTFLTCLAERTRIEQAVSEKVSSTYAPKVFTGMPEARGASPRRLEAAMERLFRAGRIERALLPWKRDRKDVFGLRLTCADRCADAAPTGCADVPDLSAPTALNTHHPLRGDVGAAQTAATPVFTADEEAA